MTWVVVTCQKYLSLVIVVHTVGINLLYRFSTDSEGRGIWYGVAVTSHIIYLMCYIRDVFEITALHYGPVSKVQTWCLYFEPQYNVLTRLGTNFCPFEWFYI